MSTLDRHSNSTTTCQNSFQEASRTVHPAWLIRGDKDIQAHHTWHKGQEEQRHGFAELTELDLVAWQQGDDPQLSRIDQKNFVFRMNLLDILEVGKAGTGEG